MPRSKSLFVFAIVGALVGCGPSVGPTDRRVVDRSLRSEVRSSPVALKAAPGPLPKIPELESRAAEAVSGVDRTPLTDAIRAELLEARQASFDRVRRQLERDYLEEAIATEPGRIAAIGPQRRALRDEALLKARERFEHYAEPIGVRRLELANLVGFPDTGLPSVRRTPLSRTVDAVRPDALRNQIRELESQYYSDVALLLDESDAEFNKLLAAIRVESAVREDLALRRARSEADQLFAGRAEETLEITRFAELVVPAAPLERVEIGALPPTRRIDWTKRWSATTWAESAAELRAAQRAWAGANGYRLTANGRLGTDEFAKWEATRLRSLP